MSHLRKGQEKKLKQELLQRHLASASRMKNPIIARYAPIVGKALISLAERGAVQQSQALTTALDAYEAEIERLTAQIAEYEKEDASNL